MIERDYPLPYGMVDIIESEILVVEFLSDEDEGANDEEEVSSMLLS